LQALRAEFPHALFFTTDLDARLLDPSANIWERNLIVASAFSIEADTLSFRDSYQTALYRACRMALTNGADTPPSPVLFEIGRTCAVRLPLSGQAGQTEPALRLAGPLRWWSLRVIFPGFLALLGAAFMLGMFRSVSRIYYSIFDPFSKDSAADGDKGSGTQFLSREDEQRQRDLAPRRKGAYKQRLRALTIVVLLSLFAFIVTGIFAKLDNHRDTGEPFAWLEGTSVWPTILVRILVIGFCFGAMTWAWYTFKARQFDFFALYRLRDSAPAPTKSTKREAYRSLLGWYRWLVEHRRAASITRWSTEDDDLSETESDVKVLDAQDLFSRYHELAQFKYRLWRAVPLAVALFLLSGGVMAATGGFLRVPYRGDWSRLWERFTLLGSVVSIVLLISYVVDVARLAERYINQLGTGVTRWPDALFKNMKEKTGFHTAKDDKVVARINDEVVSGMLDVRFVADYTARINTVLYLPFIALCLLLLSRNSYFDRWPWPFALQFIFILNFALTFVCSWCIRRASSKVKSDAIRRMTLAEMHQSDDSGASDRIDRAMKYTDDIRDGAYASWLLDPSVIGTLIPTGSAGLIAILIALFGQ
jgi:hypothetical protein